MNSLKKVSLTLFLTIDTTDGTPWDSCTWACELGLRACKNACSDAATITNEMSATEIAEVQGQVQQCQFDCVIPYEACNDACNNFYKPYYDLPYNGRPSIEDWIADKLAEDKGTSDTDSTEDGDDSDTDGEPDPLDENGEGCPRQCSGNTLLEHGRRDESGECIYNPTECSICVETEGWPHCGETEEEQKDKLKLEIQKKIIAGQEECIKAGWAKQYVGLADDEIVNLDFEGAFMGLSGFGNNFFTDCKFVHHFPIDQYDLENLDTLEQINDKFQEAFDDILDKKAENEVKERRAKYKKLLQKEAATEVEKEKRKRFLDLSEEAVDWYMKYMYDSDELMIRITEIKFIETYTDSSGEYDYEEAKRLAEKYNKNNGINWNDNGKWKILHETRPDFASNEYYTNAQETVNRHFETYVRSRIAVHKRMIEEFEAGTRSSLPTHDELHNAAWNDLESDDFQAMSDLTPDHYEYYLRNYYEEGMEAKIDEVVEDQYENDYESFSSGADSEVRTKLYMFDVVHSK